MTIIDRIAVVFIVYWAISAWIVIREAIEDWPDIEKEMLEGDDTVNAMGGIPPQIKYLSLALLFFLAPGIILCQFLSFIIRRDSEI